MRVNVLMSHPVVSCGPDDTLDRAAGLMWDHDYGALPVVSGGHVVGLITDRDVCMAAYTEARLLADIPVSRAMAAQVVVCRDDDTVKHAEALMAEHQVRRLPVVNGQGVLVGILSIDDLARRRGVAATEVMDTLASVVEPRVGEISE